MSQRLPLPPARPRQGSLAARSPAIYEFLQRFSLTADDVSHFAYQISGEYAMIAHAAEAGILDRRAAMLESLWAFRRAGAKGVLTYFALEAARALGE